MSPTTGAAPPALPTLVHRGRPSLLHTRVVLGFNLSHRAPSAGFIIAQMKEKSFVVSSERGKRGHERPGKFKGKEPGSRTGNE